MPKITIDNKEIEAEEGLTIIQACQEAGIEVPHFCYHEKLAIAGNCRMCLVEVEKSHKPVASCAVNVSEGMVIKTDTDMVKKAREGVMEFLLINHPLDCPICDQGGECDLQDQAFKYGGGKSRYSENKRAVPNKDIGPLVKTEMNRCIHCMRCVRFATDIAGIEEIGTIGRGEHAEVTTYVESTLKSEMSGNIIDLCPVGALTAKPYAFTYRNWELKSIPSIDVMDAVGSNILVGTRSMEVMRILPLLNEDVNEEWISDKTRFAFDGLKNQRLDRPYTKKAGKLMPSSWAEAIGATVSALIGSDPKKIGGIAGTLCDLESMHLLKKLMNNLGSNNIDFNQFGYKFDRSSRSNYLFNTSIAGIEESDLCLIIGADPRRDAPVLNSRIGRMVRNNKMKAARIGHEDDQTYKLKELGSDSKILEQILSGKHSFVKDLKSAKNPMIIVGEAAYSRGDGLDISYLASEIAKKYNGKFNMLHNHASSVGALDLGFTNDKYSAKDIAKKMEVIFLLGADEIEIPESNKDAFVIYLGHHGDRGAHRADVILPACAYTEKEGLYINTEGRVQESYRAVQPIGEARDDRDILLQLIRELGYTPPPNMEMIREEIAEIIPAAREVGALIDSGTADFKKRKVSLLKKPIGLMEKNFYMTDPISRASVTMAKCSSK